jgi:hypothetical protein
LQRRERERENSVARLLCEVVGQLLVVEMVVVKSVVGCWWLKATVERERESSWWQQKWGERLISPFSGHEIHSYL